MKMHVTVPKLCIPCIDIIASVGSLLTLVPRRHLIGQCCSILVALNNPLAHILDSASIFSEATSEEEYMPCVWSFRRILRGLEAIEHLIDGNAKLVLAGEASYQKCASIRSNERQLALGRAAQEMSSAAPLVRHESCVRIALRG